jgi:AraC-like DNA-binding protein
MFVEAIRERIAAQEPGDGWLAGLGDAFVGRALAALYADPARGWTVGTLAREAGASRTTLTDRFSRFCGLAPMAYLTHWRMQLAARRLAEGGETVGRIAFDVGYGSEAAFSRAFKRVAGVSPAKWRRQARAGES